MLRKIEKPRIPTIACPHCDTRAKVRSSEQMTSLVRELRFTCDNDACGHTFLGTLEITRTITPSARPNPAVNLPMTPRRPKPEPANDDGPILSPAAANDNAMSRTG